MDISTLQSNLNFIKSLYLLKEWENEDCKNEVLAAIKECNQKIEKAFGWSMHYLHHYRPSVEAVEKVVQKFPSTLSCVDEDDGRIPIQSAAVTDGHEYIPVLVKEGVKHKVGGEDARGGLLLIDPGNDYGYNTLQWFVNVAELEDEDAKTRVDILKQLKKSDMLLKKDIQEHCLLRHACNESARQRFDFLVEWDPDALMETRFLNQPFALQKNADSKCAIVVEAGFKYFPNTGGLLFVNDGHGTTLFDTICSKIGTEETMTMLHNILSPNCNYPILHHAFIKAPERKDLFMEKFPWAYQLKDHNGRTLQQAVLAAGPDIMKSNKILFATLTDDQIRVKDPITTLYPFAAMAVGEHADLEKTFYLLRRHPSVLDRHTRADSTISRQRNENSERGSRKRRKVKK